MGRRLQHPLAAAALLAVVTAGAAVSAQDPEPRGDARAAEWAREVARATGHRFKRARPVRPDPEEPDVLGGVEADLHIGGVERLRFAHADEAMAYAMEAPPGLFTFVEVRGRELVVVTGALCPDLASVSALRSAAWQLLDPPTAPTDYAAWVSLDSKRQASFMADATVTDYVNGIVQGIGRAGQPVRGVDWRGPEAATVRLIEGFTISVERTAPAGVLSWGGPTDATRAEARRMAQALGVAPSEDE